MGILLAIFQSTHSVGSGTSRLCQKGYGYYGFQSTHSVGSGTDAFMSDVALSEISIHPLRGEWDAPLFFSVSKAVHFNPPTPWGVGLAYFGVNLIVPVFQSTHSVGSGTCSSYIITHKTQISIHPLRGEWDSKTAQKNMQFLYKANNVTDSVCILCAYDHETSKNFVHLFTLFCANLPGILCSLMVRIRQPKSLPLHTTFSLRNAQPLFDSDSRDNKIAGYLCLYP